jgi:small conductance mechanosensitive channel
MKPLQIPVAPAQIPDSIPSVKQEVAMLKSMPLDDLLDKFISSVTTFAINLAIAIVVFYAGKFVIKKLYNLLSVILHRRNVDRSLTTFVLSMVKMLLFFILIVTVIGILGIETSSFIALFASAGVAIGMALSGTLQNFAGGVLILLLKPYKVGDYIEAQGFAGTVKEIQIFHTIITTYDNKAIIIPNGGLSTGSVNNWSREDYRRVDWSVGISYGDNVEDARKRILELLEADPRVVKRYIEEDRLQRAGEQERRRRAAMGEGDNMADERRPRQQNAESIPVPELPWYRRMFMSRKKKAEQKESDRVIRLRRRVPRVERRPVVVVDQLADSAVVLKVRAWTRTEFYWDVYYQVNEQIYNELPKAGISFPFPQMDVHLSRQ